MSLQSVIRWLLPREDRFYTLLERQAVMLHEAAQALAALGTDPQAGKPVFTKVDEIEHQGDELFHQVETLLSQTFVTPIDREDIHLLASRLDDILDLTKTTAQTYVVYGVERMSEPMRKQMALLVSATSVLREAMPGVRRHAWGEVLLAVREITKFEKEGDSVFREALGALFRDDATDAKMFLREKEVLDDLEQALNRCEAVADLLANLAVKHG